ncbi:MAG: hypothetical protein PWQ95_1755 [Thermococcaceae archaeon]|nr:hypothetical protein [Thermococcaceae archaeon]
MRRTIGISLFLLFMVSVVFLLFISAPERYLIQLHAEFPEPVEFKGAELLEGYPNELTHVSIFRFKELPAGKNISELEEIFDVAPDSLLMHHRTFS